MKEYVRLFDPLEVVCSAEELESFCASLVAEGFDRVVTSNSNEIISIHYAIKWEALHSLPEQEALSIIDGSVNTLKGSVDIGPLRLTCIQ